MAKSEKIEAGTYERSGYRIVKDGKVWHICNVVDGHSFRIKSADTKKDAEEIVDEMHEKSQA